MQSYEKRLEHAETLGIDENCVGWTIVLMNRGPKAINNSLIGYHWVVGIISPEGQVFYGDPLNSVEVPKNFQDMVNPYYKARFGTDIPDVFNCSNVEMFPNFPKQLSDAHICGFVGLLVMLLAKEPRYLQFILSGNKLDSNGLDFINFPGKYPIYIKQIFQILFVEKRIPTRLLVTRAEIKQMVKQSSLWAKLPFSRNKQNTTRIPGMPLAEHLNATCEGRFKLKKKKMVKRMSNEEEEPQSKLIKDHPNKPVSEPNKKEVNIKKKQDTALDEHYDSKVAKQPNVEVAQEPVNNEFSQQPELEVSQQPELEVSQQPDLEPSQQPELEVSQQADLKIDPQSDTEVEGLGMRDVSNHQTEEIVYNGKFLGEIIWDGKTSIENNDGYNWKTKGKKKGAKYLQEYICIEDCQGTKFAKKQNHFDFGGKFGAVWKVNYTVEHTCERKGLKKVGHEKKILNSSYILGRIGNPGQTDTNVRPRNQRYQAGQTQVVRKNKNKIQETRTTTIEPTIEVPANELEKDSENAEVSDGDNGDIESHGLDLDMSRDMFSQNSILSQDDSKKAKVSENDSDLMVPRFIDE